MIAIQKECEKMRFKMRPQLTVNSAKVLSSVVLGVHRILNPKLRRIGEAMISCICVSLMCRRGAMVARCLPTTLGASP